MIENEDFFVKDLPDRYGIGRTWLYKAYLPALEKAGLGKPAKQGHQGFVSPEQLKFLDGFDIAIKDDRADEFLIKWGIKEQGDPLAKIDPTIAILTLASAVLTLNPINPLARYEALQEACDRGWLLSTSDLAPLLRRAKLSGTAIERYGFRCDRLGRNGAESAWRISKITTHFPL